MASKAVYSIVAVVGIAAASGAAWWTQNKPKLAPTETPASAAPAGAGTPGQARPPSVEVARVETVKLVDDTQAVGSLRSRQSVILRPEVSGRITQLNFRDGDRVRKGQLLVQFDDQLPLAQVKQSQAELSIATANHKRNQDLVSQNFISQRSVDESAANLEVALAKLALAQATAARLKIMAPFNGVTGIRLVHPGDYLKDGADIVNLEDLEAVYVDFRLPERFQAKLRRGQRTVVDLDALPGAKFAALIQAIDPLIDANGRSVSIRACIDNRQLQLRPGMFARVTTVFGERERAMVIPEEAIVPQGARQFVIKVVDGPDADSKTTRRVEVKVGLRRPGRVEIVEGLGEGDVVVTAGQQRIQRDGTVVRVVDVARGGAPAAVPPRAAASGAAASAAVAAASSPAAAGPSAAARAGAGTTVAKAAPRAPEGPNPCLQEVADASPAAGGMATGQQTPPASAPSTPRRAAPSASPPA